MFSKSQKRHVSNNFRNSRKEDIGSAINNAMKLDEGENEELKLLNAEAGELEERIAVNVARLLET